MKRNFVVGITGASGAVYALRLVEVLSAAACNVHLTISPNALPVLRQELGIRLDLDAFDLGQLRLDRGVHLIDPKLARTRVVHAPVATRRVVGRGSLRRGVLSRRATWARRSPAGRF